MNKNKQISIKRNYLLIIFIFLISTFYSVSILSNKNLSGMRIKVLDFHKEGYNVDLTIVDIKEESMILDIEVFGVKDSLNSLFIKVFQEVSVDGKRITGGSEFETNVSLVEAQPYLLRDDDYVVDRYYLKDVKVPLSNQNFMFPFKGYFINLEVMLLHDNVLNPIKTIRVIKNSNWISLDEVDQGLNFGFREIDNGLENTAINEFITPLGQNNINISFSYSSIYQWSTGLILASIFILIFLTNKICFRDKIGINQIGIIAALLIGLPGVLPILKQDHISTITIIDLTIIIYILWIISIPIIGSLPVETISVKRNKR
jgi:hypothetical protein